MHFPFSVYSSFGLQLPSLQNFPLHFVLIEEPDRLQMCKMQAKDLCDFLFVRGEGNMEELAFFFFLPELLLCTLIYLRCIITMATPMARFCSCDNTS